MLFYLIPITLYMKKLTYQIEIKSPSTIVFDKMLGLTDIKSYESWTAPFNPTSTYEGDWKKGSKILLVGSDKDGNKAGMVARILENIPNQFISIQHYGMLENGEEITSGPKVESWAGNLENYKFEDIEEGCLVTIEIDAGEGSESYMDKLYPKALEKLKEICE